MPSALLCVLLLPGSAQDVDFGRDVGPILGTRCAGCHGPRKQKSSLRLDSRAALLQGGDHGPAAEPGHPERSRLMRLVASTDPGQRMPPEGEPLSPGQVDTLRRWILQGAVWPDAGASPGSRAEHWSFRPLSRPPVPAAPPGVRHPIDAFLAERLAHAGLKMSPAASPRVFVRRATLDLTGLPPTPEEADAFERDCREGPVDDAVERLVDRLLASPRYGERWAQHWLDVIRYADTHGYESNGLRPGAWPYRDYVVRALNADLPYGRFLLEQLAGDTVGVDAATGFLVTAPFPSRIEIGQEEAAIAQARYNAFDEVLQNVGSAMLGLTVGCARCHDHKFDPVSARDYYRLAASFSGLQFVDRAWRSGPRPDEALRTAERRVADVRRELAAFPARREVGPDGAVEVFPPVLASAVRLVVLDTQLGRRHPPAFSEVEVRTAPSSGPPRNVGAAEAGALARSSGAYAALGSRDAFLNDGRTGRDSMWISAPLPLQADRFRAGDAWVEVAWREPARIDRVAWSCDGDEQGPDRVPLRWRMATQWRIEVLDGSGAWRPASPELPAGEQEKRKRLEGRFTAAATRLHELGHVFAGRFNPPEPVHVLSRGDPLKPREPAPPGSIDALGGYELPPDTAGPARRVALAEWLARHPLTARVLVNRVWRHHFGAGIVDTPSDFGTQGEAPTHPELLDWLASGFAAGGGRLKALHRLICTSGAYRQDSRPDAAAARVDAGSRLLWRFPPRRLEAEAVRDGILFASGALDLSAGGPGANLFKDRPPQRGEWEPKEDPGPETWRRSIYLLRMRGADDGVFKSFDLPDCGQVRAKRGESTTPLQALNLFNSPFVLRQAGLLADRARREAGDDPCRQVERAFALVLARPPASRERADCAETARLHGLPAVCRALLNSNEFLFLE